MAQGVRRSRAALMLACWLLPALHWQSTRATTPPDQGTSAHKSMLDEWDQRELTLRQSVWRTYSATAAFGRDARGRTVRDDLNEWVMTGDLRTQLRAARAEAEHQLRSENAAAARATWDAAKALLEEQSRRLSLIDTYWWERMTLGRIRGLWLGWLKDTPDDAAAASKKRIDELESRLTQDYGPARTPEALRNEINELKIAYDDERRKLAALVSARQVSAGVLLASRDRSVPCLLTRPTTNIAMLPTGYGDRPPGLMKSLPAEQYYPSGAKTNYITGDVILEVTVGIDGCMKHAGVASSSGDPELDDTALDLAERATFRPAEKAGRAVEGTFKVKYHFVLDDGRAAAAPTWSPPLQTAASHLDRGYQLLSRGEFDQAIAELDQAIAYQPGNATALANRAIAYMWKHEDDRARSDLDAAFAVDAHNVTVFLGRGTLALRSNDFAGAIAAFSTALERNPDNLFALQWRTEAYLRSGNPDGALADNAQAIRLKPDRGDLYVARALVLRSQRKAEEALVQAQAVVAANPNDGHAYIAAGSIYAAAKHEADAMRSFDRAVELAPNDWAYLARAQHRPRSDLAGRKADIEAALKLNPASQAAAELLADAQSDAGDYASAIATLSAALATRPDADTLLTRRSILYVKDNQPSLAQQDLEKVRARAATDATAQNNLCWALATAGVKLQDALISCDAALAKAPKESAYLDSRGFVLLRMGRNTDAIAAYNDALKGRPLATMSLYGRGLAKRRQGDAAGADADIYNALVLDATTADKFAEFGLQ